MITDEQVDQLAQVLRRAYVITKIGRNSRGFVMVEWSSLSPLDREPYVAQAVAAYRALMPALFLT